ncbi:MAG: benzoate/H(+) symporter BenE family transporter [Chloroflexi bacterium]|nr:benzoate/H(+) symporter BenE family transporter [Chloroflexota bacterium]
MTTFPSLRHSAVSTFSFRGLNRQAASAGLNVFAIYMFVGLTVQVGVMTQLGLSDSAASGWFFITWMTTGGVSLVLSLATKQPVSINLSIAAMVFLAGAAGGFTLPQILGANLIVGVASVAVSVFRLTDAMTRVVPSQIAIGVFAGSMLGFILRTGDLAASSVSSTGPAIGGYALALLVTRSQVMAIAIAATAGLVGVLLTGGMQSADIGYELPLSALPVIEFNLRAIVSLGIPLFILTAGVGNIQGLAILRGAGYRIRGNMLGVIAGGTSIINALAGGHPAAVGSVSVVVSSAPSAGPAGARYWAIVLSSVPVIAIAMLAVPVIAIVQALPIAYTLTVGALAMLAPFRQTFAKTMSGDMRLGALAAFALAAVPYQALGMPMAFWALVAGVAISGVFERRQLITGRK